MGTFRSEHIEYPDYLKKTEEGILIIDKKGKVKYANDSILITYGKKRRDVVGEHISSLFSGLSKNIDAKVSDLYRRVQASNNGVVWVTRTKREGTGKRRGHFDHWRIRLSCSSKDKLVFFVMSKITVIEYQERRLVEDIRFYENIVNNIQDVIYMTDDRGYFIYVSPSAEKVLGYGLKELTQMNYLQLIHPEWKRKVKNFYKKQFRKKKGHTYLEFPVVTGKGKTVWMGQQVELLKDGNWIIGFCVVARDISPYKSIERQLVEEKNLAQQYLELSGVIFLALDANEQITMLNYTGCQLLHYDCVVENGECQLKKNGFCSVIGMNWFEHFVPEHEREQLRMVYRQLLEGNMDYEYRENHVLCKDGTKILVAWRNVSLKNEEGDIIGILSSGTDITERKQLESSRMNAVLEGEEKERRRIAGELHDGIQPLLSTIRHRMEVFNPEKKAPSPKLISEYENIVTILDKTQQELKTISYNLTPPALKEFGLSMALRELCESLDRLNHSTVRYYDSGVEHQLDAVVKIGLYRIAQELLNNAMKHARASAITLQLIGYPAKIVLMIEDNGEGFEQAKSKKGIGLNSILARVNALGGKMNFDSQKSVGTTVMVEIPLDKKEHL